MLLAGGQGSRLLALTKRNAKPAVAFGGKYRIIDFSLSNCVNSNIDTVGVLTQYKPLILNSYLGTGEAWDLDDSDGGVHVLPPYATEQGGEWYNGTADAIYHNIDFIDNLLIPSTWSFCPATTCTRWTTTRCSPSSTRSRGRGS